MTDIVLIQAGKAYQVVAGTTKLAYCYALQPGEDEPRPRFTPELIAATVEVDSGTVHEGDLWDGTSFSAPPAPILTADDLKAYASAARFARETAGITVNGAAVATDRASQAMISAAFNYVQQNSGATIQWKTADGAFVALDATAITAIANAVGAHVQACFAKEAEICGGIDGGSITTTAAIDTAFADVA